MEGVFLFIYFLEEGEEVPGGVVHVNCCINSCVFSCFFAAKFEFRLEVGEFKLYNGRERSGSHGS